MPPASDNIWVGDLPVGMDKADLATLFEAYGTVLDCRILPGRGEGTKPCAMVRFASLDMAEWVVENLNGNIPEGLSEPIIARFANAQSGKSDGGGWGAAKGGGGGAASAPYGGGGKSGGFVPPSPSDNVWIGDLPLGTDKPDLADIFEAYGQIQDCRMLPGRDANAKPCAMVRFASVEMATWVVENLNGNIPQGLAEPIIARFANSGGSGGGGGSSGGGKGAGGGGAWQAPASAPVQAGGGWQAAAAGGWQAAGKGGASSGGKGKKGNAPGSFQALFQSVKGAGILGGGKVPDDCQCFIKNLPADTVDDDLYKLFSPFGAIPPAGVKAMAHADGTCKGFGFVDFSDAEAAETAVMALDGHTTADGTIISVSQKKPSLKAASGGKGK